MTTKAQFTIAQCVPDPLTDERINFGVIVFAEGKTYSRFTSNWRRIAAFSGQDTLYLKEFADSVSEISEKPDSVTSMNLFPLDTGSWLKRAVNEWENSIQFTDARPSLDDPWKLLERLSKRHLKGEAGRQQQGRTKGQVAATVFKLLETELALRVGASRAKHLTHKHLALNGHTLRTMQFDIGVMNGVPYGIGQAVSFQTGSVPELRSAVGLATLMLEDAQRKHGELDLALMVAPPEQGIPNRVERLAILDDARFSCAQFGALVVEEEDPFAWIDKVTESVTSTASIKDEAAIL